MQPINPSFASTEGGGGKWEDKRLEGNSCDRFSWNFTRDCVLTPYCMPEIRPQKWARQILILSMRKECVTSPPVLMTILSNEIYDTHSALNKGFRWMKIIIKCRINSDFFFYSQRYKNKSGLSQKRDWPILVVIGSQNKNPLADSWINSYARDIPVRSLEFQQFRYYFLNHWKINEKIWN